MSADAFWIALAVLAVWPVLARQIAAVSLEREPMDVRARRIAGEPVERPRPHWSWLALWGGPWEAR